MPFVYFVPSLQFRVLCCVHIAPFIRPIFVPYTFHAQFFFRLLSKDLNCFVFVNASASDLSEKDLPSVNISVSLVFETSLFTHLPSSIVWTKTSDSDAISIKLPAIPLSMMFILNSNIVLFVCVKL